MDLLRSRYGPASGVLALIKESAKELKCNHLEIKTCYKDLIVENSKSEEDNGLQVTVEVLRRYDEEAEEYNYYALLTRDHGDLLSYKLFVQRVRTILEIV